MDKEQSLPVVSLAYQSNEFATDWWAAARLVARLGFWYGIVRLAQLVVQLTATVFNGYAMDSVVFYNYPLSGTILTLAIGGINVVGCGMMIVGCQRMKKLRIDGIKTTLWGAILLAFTIVVPATLSLLQVTASISRFGSTSNFAFYVAQSSLNALAATMLPAYIAYFFSRPQLRHAAD